MAKKANKVIIGGETIVDMTDATATAADVIKGKTAYTASGEIVTGTAMSADEFASLTVNELMAL